MTDTGDANVSPVVGSIEVIFEQVVHKEGNTGVVTVKGEMQTLFLQASFIRRISRTPHKPSGKSFGSFIAVGICNGTRCSIAHEAHITT